MHLNPLQKLALRRLSTNSDYYLIQWWVNKYTRPPNDPLLLELTWEELYLEYITDFYSRNPKEREEAETSEGLGSKTWSGGTTDEYEEKIKEKLKKVTEIDLSKWQTPSEHNEDEFDDDYTKEIDSEKDRNLG